MINILSIYLWNNKFNPVNRTSRLQAKIGGVNLNKFSSYHEN